MSKYLKRYNEATEKWELVSAPDVSVIQKLEDGSDITDTNVIITNVNYAGGESGETTLDETLTEISDDISRLQRNVSWLAEFGGGGGTGGGGDQKSFGIEVISPVLTDNAAYVSEKTFEVEFMITGGTDGDECQYAYTYDGTQTDFAIAKVNQSIKIPIDNTLSPKKQHDMAIRAINPYGSNIPAKSFTIYESTLTLAFDTATAGEDYKNGVYNIRLNSTYAYIPLVLTNGLMNSTTVLTAKYSDVSPKSIEFINSTTEPQKLQMSLWDIAPKTSFEPDRYYIVKFNASATLGVNIVYSNEVELRIRIINPSEISISMGVNGTSGEQVQAPLNSSVVYNFRVYTPAFIPPVESTYYSAKITDGETSYLILGQYYDDETCIPGKGYQDNDSISVGTTVSSQYVLSSANFQSVQTVELCVRVWNMSGDRTASASTEILITAESNEIFPRQSNLRGGTIGNTGNTIFLSWNKVNADPVSPTAWVSTRNDYAFMDGDLAETQGNTVIAGINVLNVNSESKITIDPIFGTPYLRLQNRAYAKANLTQYEKEVKMITAEHSENYGFTISFTFMEDTVNDTKHTLLLWGENGADGTLVNGIRVDADKAYWVIKERTSGQSLVTKTISCPITSNVRTTVDFSYVKTPNGATARIYLNGILNAATDLNIISPLLEYTFPNEIYFGANYRQNNVERFTDLNIYEFSVYTRSLNDLQIVVNGKNARYTTLSDYTNWKTKNFITAKQTDEKVPESVFFDNGDYKAEFSGPQVQAIALRSTTTPTLYLNFSETVGFSSSYFYAKHTTQETGTTYPGKASYYDPSTNRWADNISILASLQGTSTLGYRIKNLEFYIDETFEREGQTYKKLFQPKKEWFPESQFTLKADVVDSAHANNAVLGEWINNCGLFEDNPAMEQFGANRPIDVNDQGQTRPDWGVDSDVTIKHTLEGFPILLFIKFSDKNFYTFLGIYSFNLGRYSYYNMGMKFLKCFSRRDGDTKVACPKIINYYEEMENLGNVSGSNVYSFEMGNGGNENVNTRPVWSQYDQSVVKTYGDFKYPSSISDSDSVWSGLCNAFKSIAEFRITYYHGDNYNKYDGIRYYRIIGGQYIDQGPVDQRNDSIGAIDSRIGGSLHIHNAMAYFVIANAFGMTDSLGKNLTLRTWDGGKTWYCCFYDMDTALGLANDGSESNPITVAIDKVSMISDPETSTSVLVTTYHDEDSKYAAFSSKIWGVFRDDRFFYLTDFDSHYTYEYLWGELRRAGGKLSRSTNFSDIMAARVDSCGEMIYDYDYNTKYIQDTAAQDSGATAAINFLHGTRVEYVRDWLRKHFYFLDGIFDVNWLEDTVQFTFEDSPYNSDILTLAVNYSSSIAVLPYTMQVSTPAFIGMTIGNDAFKKFYIGTDNTDTIIYLNNGTSANSQLSIKGSTLITKINGLQNGFLAIGNNENGVAKSLSIFDVSSSRALNENPLNIDAEGGIFGRTGSLESIDLSNTQGITTLQSYDVFLEPFNKLINVDISNSNVTSLSLPSTALQSLSFHHSNIANFTLRNQSIINGLNFEGCDKLQTIAIEKCDAITSLVIDSKPLLTSISIQNCNSIKSIDIIDCTALQTINIYNLPALERLTVRSDFGAGAVNTTIYNCGNLSSLTLNNIYSAQTVTIDSLSAAAVKYLNLDGFFYFSGFKFNGNPVETYGGDFVVDLTPFTSLRGENFSANNVLKVHYIRVKNDNDPFKIPQNFTRSSKTVLTRIFGHFSIYGPDQFLECNQFYIREPLEQIGGETPFDDEYYVWEEGSGATNVTIATNDLTNVFRSTNCSLSDVYYIFKQSRSGISAVDVEVMQGTFFGCKNVITTMEDQLNRDLFSGLTKLYNIDELFNGADIGGYLDGDILLPISDNINNFDKVFGINDKTENKYYTKYDTCFFPIGNKIKTIVGFNPLPHDIEWQEPYPVYDTEMLSTLTEVEFIDNSFNSCWIDFTNGGYDQDCDLFKTTTKLKKIRNSFLKVMGWGSLRNIFGGNSSTEGEYPQNLESIVNSFSFVESATVEGSYFPSDHGDIAEYCPINSDIHTHFGVLMPIGNSFFKKIKYSIKNIGGRDNSNYSERCFYSEDVDGRPGNGLRKYLDLGDCDGETFCYKIFDGCENLEEIPYFFEGLDFGVTGLTASTIPILFDSNGQSMFSGLTKLWNINGLFANMKNILYTLSGNAFEDCAIVTAAYAFKEGDSSNDTTNAKRIGAIPYKLFYQGDVENTISGDNFGISKQTAADMGILADFEAYIASSGDPSEYYYIGVDSAEKFKLNFTYNTPKGLITNLSHVFENSNSSAVSAYASTSTIFDEWIEDNEKYNPIMFYVVETVSGFVYTYNEEYVPYKKKWNKFIFDGTSDFIYRITSSTEYQKLINGDPEFIDEYGNPILDKDMPELWDYAVEDFLSDLSKYDTGIDRISSSDPIYQELFGLQNYFCPQDIFRYCANERDTLIDAAFNNGSPSIVTIGTNTWRCGLKGRIAPYIFEPITKILSMSNVFSKCRGILPHRWATIENGVTKLGTIYPPTLFSGLTLMTTCTSTFSEGSVWGRTVVPQELFSTNTQLVNISSMWSQTTWIENTIKTDAPSGLTEQFPVGMFANNVKLANISNLFAWGGPFIMSTNLLTLANNPSLSNTAGFLYRGNNLQDTSRVPTLWTGWDKIKNYENTFFGISQAIISAQNIPEDWWIER